MGWWDVKKASRSHNSLTVSSLYVYCAAFWWVHNACYFSAGQCCPGRRDADGAEAAALLCRSGSAIRLAAKHRETLRAA